MYLGFVGEEKLSVFVNNKIFVFKIVIFIIVEDWCYGYVRELLFGKKL